MRIDPAAYDGALFDLDGVITDTASVHEAAWKQLFDEFLHERGARNDEDHAAFTQDDYLRHVDGRPRHDGVAAFLASRGIELPTGDLGEGPDALTVHGLGARKDGYFLERLRADGVAVFTSTVEFISRLADAGIGAAVFSASRNCRFVLDAAGLAELFTVRVDGVVAAELGLPGKPDPATLLEAARRLGVEPSRALVVEDARAGVQAGQRGGFALVIGIARSVPPEDLDQHGADLVVSDLAEVHLGGTDSDEVDSGG